MKLRLEFLFAAILLVVLPQCTAAQETIMKVTVDGKERQALVFAPTTDVAVKRPLVFAFHGHGGTMRGAAQQMHIHTVWPEAIVVYPQGVHRPSPVDPDGNNDGWEVEANQKDVGKHQDVGNKDLEFFDAMLARLREKYKVDDSRIYATGFSNGAIFTYLLWAERGNALAAIAECAGRLWPSEWDRLKEPRPVMAIAGAMDAKDPIGLQLESIEKAKAFDNANGQGETCAIPNGAAKCTFFPSTTHTPVKILIHTGGHVYPSWAPDEVVKFLKNHKRT